MLAKSRVYFDHNATTPLLPEALAAMIDVLEHEFGNASSVHAFGQGAKRRVDDARGALADLLDVEPQTLVFTSGGTEADNMALRGVAEACDVSGTARRQLVISAIEHEAVLNTAKSLGKRGWPVHILPVDAAGRVTPASLLDALRVETAIVSIMHANNEVGTLQPIAELAAVAKAHGALFHTDAVQTVGKVPVTPLALGVDLLSLSAHKFGGPKGAGALWIRPGTKLQPLLFGGRQERSRRAGTENVAAIAGLGAAAVHARRHLDAETRRLTSLRDHLEQGILSTVPDVVVNGSGARVPNTTNISFAGVEAESLLIGLDLEGIAVSTGAACSSGTLEPSHVLRAMGFAPSRVQSALRFSVGHGNDDAQVDALVAVLPTLVQRLRKSARPAVRR